MAAWRQPLRYSDQSVSGFDDKPAEVARRVMRRCGRATLATAQHDADGWPSASLVLIALDGDATPLLLISGLAEHTKNIAADDRVSLLFDGTAEMADPLAGARVTVFGRVRRSELPRHRARYLARHPGAAMYAGFGDFAFHTVAVERAHLVAGFGRIHWIDAAALLLDARQCERLAADEPGIVDHMNEDHGEANDLYARVLLKTDGRGWRMTGIDPEGCDLRLENRTARLEFARRVADAAEARAELIRCVKDARGLDKGASAA
jgi:putative heme iron utilization protein